MELADMPKPTIIYQSRVYRSDLHENRSIAYVFGDNEHRTGFGGQAKEMRGEPNAIGIATLREPGYPWSDDNYEHNCSVIDADLMKLWNWGPTIIVFPSDGIGTGLALLREEAPRTFEYLNTKLLEMFGIKNGGVK